MDSQDGNLQTAQPRHIQSPAKQLCFIMDTKRTKTDVHSIKFTGQEHFRRRQHLGGVQILFSGDLAATELQYSSASL